MGQLFLESNNYFATPYCYSRVIWEHGVTIGSKGLGRCQESVKGMGAGVWFNEK